MKLHLKETAPFTYLPFFFAQANTPLKEPRQTSGVYEIICKSYDDTFSMPPSPPDLWTDLI